MQDQDPETQGTVTGGIAAIKLGKSTAKAVSESMGTLITPKIGDVVDFFEAAPSFPGYFARLGTVVHVWSETCVNIDLGGGQIRSSVTLGRNAYGWDWPQAAK